MGNWSLAAVPNSSGGTSNGYDTLNRLVTMHNIATTSTSNQYAGQYLCWSYDAFGNRTQQSQQSTPCPASGASSSNSVLSYNSLNQLSGVTPPGGSSASPSPLSYDAAGNVVSDNGSGNTYLYDGEGRVCAVASSGPTGGALLTGYVYDADGTRVAKGTLQRWGTCDPVTNGFQPMTDYILGPGGEQLTEMAMDENGQMAWKHTNVWADGKLLATYDRDGLHYHLTDWLGTRRVQTDSGGAIEDACASLPYGDALSCIGPTFTTEHHFTGKERDQESGNDYFGARYYASTMGRFMSPDKPLADQHPNNPQSWNLYSYVRNNPLKLIDRTGTVAEIAVNGNNITITIPVYFTGPNANAQQIKAFSAQMQSAWTGQFGKYNVTTIVRQETTLLETDTNIVNIAPTKSGRDNANVGGYLMNFNPLPADGDPLYGYYLWSAGHETGHNMDLPDQYKDVKGKSVPNPGYEDNIMATPFKAPNEQDISNISNAPTNIPVGPDGEPSNPLLPDPPQPPPPPQQPPQAQQQ